MAVPTYDAFIPILLKVLAAHASGLRTRDVYEAIAKAANLTSHQTAEMLPSGRQAVYENRIGWAQDRLKRAGYSFAPRWGVWQLTDKGRALASANPNGLDVATTERIAFIPKQRRSETENDDETPASSEPQGASPATQGPEERIDDAIEELHESLSRDLLAMIGDASPSFFERLVLDLLLAMGYGVSRSDLQQTGGPGDGGIDGVITLDRLGLEKIYVQAKRWKANIGRQDIQSFFGALAGMRARLGVFLTTSAFTREARAYAKTVSDSIVLVDGAQLTTLMIEHGVGVSHRSVKIATLDTDYFDE